VQVPSTLVPQHLLSTYGTCPARMAPIGTYSTQSAPTADFTMSTYNTYSTFSGGGAIEAREARASLVFTQLRLSLT